jgi:hypothetical protein
MDVSNFLSSSNIMKFDDVIGVILSEEMRQKRTSETLGNALIVETRGRKNERGKSPGNHGNSRKGRSRNDKVLEFQEERTSEERL